MIFEFEDFKRLINLALIDPQEFCKQNLIRWKNLFHIGRDILVKYHLYSFSYELYFAELLSSKLMFLFEKFITYADYI